ARQPLEPVESRAREVGGEPRTERQDRHEGGGRPECDAFDHAVPSLPAARVETRKTVAIRTGLSRAAVYDLPAFSGVPGGADRGPACPRSPKPEPPPSPAMTGCRPVSPTSSATSSPSASASTASTRS